MRWDPTSRSRTVDARPTRRWRVGAAVLATLLVSGCGTPDDDLHAEVEQLQAQLAGRDAGQAELIERIEALEGRLAALQDHAHEDEGDEVGERLTEIDDHLGEVDATLATLEEGLEDGLQAAAAGRSGLASDLEATDQELRGAIAELRGAIDELRGSIAVIEDQVAILRDRMDNR